MFLDLLVSLLYVSFFFFFFNVGLNTLFVCFVKLIKSLFITVCLDFVEDVASICHLQILDLYSKPLCGIRFR